MPGETFTALSLSVKFTNVIRATKFEAKDNATNVNCGFGDEGVVVPDSFGSDNAGGIFDCAFVKSSIDAFAPSRELDADFVLVSDIVAVIVDYDGNTQRLSFSGATDVRLHAPVRRRSSCRLTTVRCACAWLRASVIGELHWRSLTAATLVAHPTVWAMQLALLVVMVQVHAQLHRPR